MSNVKIFTVFHKDYWKYESNVFTSLQVGKAISDIDLGMANDASGINISAKNRFYSELTGQYWTWKNIKADYVGFCHYRRFLNFNENISAEDSVIFHTSDFDAIPENYGFDDSNIYKIIKNYDVVLPKKFVFNETVEEQYKRWIMPFTWEIMLNILYEKYPDYQPYAERMFAGNTIYPCNMYFMKWDIFDRYMQWLFDILFEAENRLYGENRIPQNRVLGHMSERLLMVFLHKLIDEENIRLKETEMVALEPWQ